MSAQDHIGTIDCQSTNPRPPMAAALARHVERIRNIVQAPLSLEGICGTRHRSQMSRVSAAKLRAQNYALAHSSLRMRSGRIGLLHCIQQRFRLPLGVLVHIHGGGMVAGHYRSAELHFDLARASCFGLDVFSIDYRRAPEHDNTGPVEDCYAALCHIVEHVTKDGQVPPVILSGNSAGGGLVAGLVLMSRDLRGPTVAGAMLQCPMLDDCCSTGSHRQFETHGIWDGHSNRTGWNALLGPRRGAIGVSPYVAAARADDLSGLPPIFIDLGSCEALRDEALSFAKRIWAQGGQCELHVWDGAFHSFDQWVPDAAVSQVAEATRRSWLARILGQTAQQ